MARATIRRALMSLLTLSLLVACDALPGATSIPPPGRQETPGATLGPRATPSPAVSPMAGDTETAEASASADVEVGVTVVASGLDGPSRIAVAPDGTVFVGNTDGRMLVRDGKQMRSVAQPEPGEEVLGLAAAPGSGEPGILYALVATGEASSEVRRFALGSDQAGADPPAGPQADAPAQGEVVATSLERPTWAGNALTVDTEGNLYAAVGDAEPAGLDVGEVASRLLEGRAPVDPTSPAAGVAPCLSEAPGSGDAQGPWRLVAQEEAVHRVSTGSGWASAGALRWMPQGAVAAAVYEQGSVPQWVGSLLVVTAEGHLLRIPTDGSGCPDLAAAEVLFPDGHGPFRDIALGPDGHLYAVTSSGASSGDDSSPGEGRVLRIGALEQLGLRYPDLQTDPPADLVVDSAEVEGETRRVLRFTNLVVNRGDGPLEVHQSGDGETVMQRVYAPDGSYLERPVASAMEHWSTGHWHFEDFNRFELWERNGYQRALAGATDVEPQWVEDKVSMCLMDLLPVDPLPGTPQSGRYTDECEAGEQGISVGWGDLYVFDIREQWVVLGENGLPDGDYVLRTIVDSEGLLHESPGGHDDSRESRDANSKVVFFTVSDGELSVVEERGD
jgi:glucose/arabinose dehydrogenase